MIEPQGLPVTWKSLWKLLGSGVIAIPAHHPQAHGQTECLNSTIGKILCASLLNDNKEHWPDYVALTEIAINSTINKSIKKVPFEVLWGESTPLPVDLLLSRESSINPHAHTFAIKMEKLITKVKSTMHDA